MYDKKKKFRRSPVTVICFVLAALMLIYACYQGGSTIHQINDYYAQLGEGLLEYVGPLVEPGPREKPLSIAMREINAGLLAAESTDS